MDKTRTKRLFLVTVCVLCVIDLIHSQDYVPQATLVAFSPKGLQIFIPATPQIKVFAFNGNINEPIKVNELGMIGNDITTSKNGRFTIFIPDVSLEVGDVINYWIYIQYQDLVYKKDGLSYTVARLSTSGLQKCTSITRVEGLEEICPNDFIIDYTFSINRLDPSVWSIEKYIPGDPDWPFNIYLPDAISLEHGLLNIKPRLEAKNAFKDLDLNPGCTGKDSECVRKYISILNPPIVSGQLRSKQVFCFGNVTIKAKLPLGDYIYPEIYLEDVKNPERRIVLAYARGNKDYLQLDGTDIGSKLLFGGPYTSVREPFKSKYLSTYFSSESIGNYWHTFNLIWVPESINLFIDGQHFGSHGSKTLQDTGFNQETMMRLVVGVGVGGPYEFPDGYTSSGHKKPYNSYRRNAIKEFLENNATWINSWSNDSRLLVELISVTAL